MGNECPIPGYIWHDGQWWHPARFKELRSAEPKPNQGIALEQATPRKAKSHGCFEIRFTVYAVRPCDWDNYYTKPLQDCLRAAGFIPDDDWRTLQGQVVTRKAASLAEERTEIEIIEL